jgi:hypothetical protein
MDASFRQDFDDTAALRSEQLAWVSRVWKDFIDDDCWSMRALLPTEVETLTRLCQCTSRDWSLLRLLLPTDQNATDQSKELARLVSRTCFQEAVVLICADSESTTGSYDDSDTTSKWKDLEPGIHSNAVIRNSIISLRARVYETTVLENTFVAGSACVIKCGHVTCSTPRSYGILTLAVGAEQGGGRTLDLTAEATMITVCDQLVPAQNQHQRQPRVRQQSTTLSSQWNVLCTGAMISDTATIDSVFLYPKSAIDAATRVVNAVLFPESSIGTASTATNVILQWNATISGMSSVTDAFFMEHAHAGPQSCIVGVVLGPDVHVATGEIHASVIGPNTNAHHQSLLISVLWPLGRGNVGYGANVGSNHTGRLPDQEAACGEGVFWGLGAIIKFPVDLSYAPYTVVASGTSLFPQRVRMPFSLIVAGNGGENNIVPGWVLRSSPFTLSRSEQKFATRQKAIHHSFYTGWKIFRPETINMCLWARQSLQNANGLKEVYSSRDINGIGSNLLTESSRLSAITTYTDCIQRFVLRGLIDFLANVPGELTSALFIAEFSNVKATTQVADCSAVEWPEFPWQVEGSRLWEFQRSLLMMEFHRDTDWLDWARNLLQKLQQLELEYTANILKSKSRDDTRGAETIPGYTESHISAGDDVVIIDSQNEFDAMSETIVKLLSRMDMA